MPNKKISQIYSLIIFLKTGKGKKKLKKKKSECEKKIYKKEKNCLDIEPL